MIGRAEELARLERLLDGGRLMLRGPRGVGVSALLDAAAELARARGLRVLHATGVQWESGFPYAGLHQLLRPLRRAAASHEALRAALGLTDGPLPRPADVAVEFASLLDGALVSVDDWQWVDLQTRATLAELAGPLLLGGHGGGPVGIEELRVGPLDPVASARLLAPELPPLQRARILREAAGRPLALLELPEAYAGADDGKLLGSWAPLTPALEEAFGCDQLDPITARLVLVAALDDGGNVPDILAAAARLSGHALAPSAFAPAVALGLIELDGERVAFTHPLTRAAVRRAADPATRRAGHEAFAAVVESTDPDRAVWHRVVAAPGLDPALAAELEAVSHRARDAGDYENATAGLRRAAHLTPPGADRDRRLSLAAQLAYEIGGLDVADRLLDEAGQPDPARVALIRARGTETLLGAETDNEELALRLRWRAATELAAVGGDGGVIARDAEGTGATAIALAGFAALVDGDAPRAAELLDRAAGELRAQRRRTLLGQVLALSAWAHFGCSAFDRAGEDAAEAVDLCARPLWGAVATAALASVAAVHGDEAATERHAAEAEKVALPRGAAYVLALVHHARGSLALAAGRPAEAYAHLRRTFIESDPAYADVPFTTARADLAEAASTEEELAFVATLDDPYVRFVLAGENTQLPSELTPFLRARALLVHGMRLRRARRMADSREPLRAAATRFIALGATPWAERAQRELAATVETAHRTDLDRLTPQELEIARMAARGMTNPAIAADLLVSPRTVSHHLTRIFPKLEVSSRASLGAALERQGY